MKVNGPKVQAFHQASMAATVIDIARAGASRYLHAQTACGARDSPRRGAIDFSRYY